MTTRAYLQLAVIVCAAVAVNGVPSAQAKKFKPPTGTQIRRDGVYRLVKTKKTANVVAAACPKGTTLLGGGCQGVGGDPLVSTAPQGASGICQFAPRKPPLQKTVFAICGPRPGGYQVVAAAREANLAWVDCPSGKTLIGGGCNTVGGDGLLASRPVGNTWTCQGKPRATPLRKEAEAICADRPSGHQIVTSTRAGRAPPAAAAPRGAEGPSPRKPRVRPLFARKSHMTTPLSKTATAVCVSR